MLTRLGRLSDAKADIDRVFDSTRTAPSHVYLSRGLWREATAKHLLSHTSSDSKAYEADLEKVIDLLYVMFAVACVRAFGFTLDLCAPSDLCVRSLPLLTTHSQLTTHYHQTRGGV